jgi:outer membrane protein assembly factor BamB
MIFFGLLSAFPTWRRVAEGQHRCQAVALQHRWRELLTRRGEWRVYVGGGNNVYALKAKTGAKLWSYSTGGAVKSSLAVANGVVYIGWGDGKVYAFGLSEVGRKQARVAFKRPRPEAASPWLQPQVVRAGRNTVRRELGGVEE